jgi:predicted RNase H-like HicB family nuclease
MYRYTVVLEGREGSYSAYVPDLPGCVAAGETREEVRRLMQEAIKAHIRGIQEDGEPVPEPSIVEAYSETVEIP